MGATLTPGEGVWPAGPIGEATRKRVNEWIRNSGEFDAVVDFDDVVLDPAGNAVMANAFNLSAFAE